MVGLKINREKVAALIAAAILALSLWGVAADIVAPRREMKVDATLPSYSRQLIPRKHRSYKLEGALARNPFSLSEGWQGMETAPLPPPPLPAAPRPVPSLGVGATPEMSGFLYWIPRPPVVPDSGGGS